MTTRPTPEQKAAREQFAEARSRTQEKKNRDRRQYRVGEVMEAHGYEDPAEVEKLMRDIERDRDSEASFNAAIERAIEEPDQVFAEQHRVESEPPPLALLSPVCQQPPASTPPSPVRCSSPPAQAHCWGCRCGSSRGGGGGEASDGPADLEPHSPRRRVGDVRRLPQGVPAGRAPGDVGAARRRRHRGVGGAMSVRRL